MNEILVITLFFAVLLLASVLFLYFVKFVIGKMEKYFLTREEALMVIGVALMAVGIPFGVGILFGAGAGRRWIDSYAQNFALRREAEKRGFRVTRIPMYFRRPQVSAERTWRRETVTVRGKPQVRHRDLKTGRFIKKP